MSNAIGDKITEDESVQLARQLGLQDWQISRLKQIENAEDRILEVLNIWTKRQKVGVDKVFI